MLINTDADLQTAEHDDEREAFLIAMLNDYIVFDDAPYPPDYDRTLESGDDGYITPIIRKEWNAGAAAAWGFADQAAIEAVLKAMQAKANGRP